jgi:CRISPR-associated protein Csb1
MSALSLKELQSAVAGSAAAFRCRTEYQPAGGEGDKVFPPTYEGGRYAEEKRFANGRNEPMDCVLLDSVQSQANRMELALLNAWERKRLSLPVISVDFKDQGLPKTLKITSLEAPHRIADALLRDSLHGDTPFRRSEFGSQLDHVDNRNATPLFQLCPTALLFGMWDSTGPRRALGAKFARAMVSELIGLDAVQGKKTSSRIDPAQIMLDAGPLYSSADGGWTLDPNVALKEKKVPIKFGEDGRPSKANHGNVMPSIVDGGFTISKAVQTTVLSLASLRRLRFPLNGNCEPATDDLARTVLSALGLCAATLMREGGCDLRSRCQLIPTQEFVWELLDQPGSRPKTFSLTGDQAIELFNAAVKQARTAGLPWMESELALTPSPQLVALVKKSQELALQTVSGDAEGE